MTATKCVAITCNWCNGLIGKDEQYFRIDTMIREKSTLWKDRQLKHCCMKCIPGKLKKSYKLIDVKNMDNVTYRNYR